MDKYILQELSEAERKQTLIDNADGVEEMGYTKPMTQKQIDDTKQLLAEETIQLKDVEAAKKTVDADYNSQIKTHKQNISEAAEMLKAKGKYVIGKVYKMVDLDAKRVGLYSPEGMLVTERLLNRTSSSLDSSQRHSTSSRRVLTTQQHQATTKTSK